MSKSIVRRTAFAVGICALLATIAPVASAQAPIVIKFSHVVTPDTPKGKAALRFRQLAEEGSQGRVEVEVYPNSQLCKDKEELEALQLGAVQMLAPSLSKFGPLGAKQFEMFDLPCIFQTEEQFVQVTRGKIGQSLMASLEDKSIKGLAFWSGGLPKHMVLTNHPHTGRTQGLWPDAGAEPHAGRARGLAQDLVAGAQGNGVAHRRGAAHPGLPGHRRGEITALGFKLTKFTPFSGDFP